MSSLPRIGLPFESPGWSAMTHGQSGATVLRDEDGSRYAKIVPVADADTLEAERDRISWLSGTGVPCPEVLDWQIGEHGARLITSAVAGVPASDLDPARLRAAWPSIAETVRHLHTIPPASCPYGPALERMMALARTIVAQGRVHTEFLPRHLRHVPPAEILQSLERELPRRKAQVDAEAVVCHGDLCLPNIMIDPDTLNVTGLIDLGRLGRADPYADLALLLANARGTWPDEDTARRCDQDLADRYGITLDPDRRDFYLRLDPLTW